MPEKYSRVIKSTHYPLSYPRFDAILAQKRPKIRVFGISTKIREE